MHTTGTLEDLAAAINVDPTSLRARVNRFNGFARTGVDEDFQRGESRWDLVLQSRLFLAVSAF
ncbi:hypothetical protein GCM10022381_29910 [Leifsonia kafniensis]|uniref:Uncharacterized protein n=1 Tax=Leifsonia kafniensis TaxID=475957 RepID=A0ABP7KTX7_9MICO